MVSSDFSDGFERFLGDFGNEFDSRSDLAGVEASSNGKGDEDDVDPSVVAVEKQRRRIPAG